MNRTLLLLALLSLLAPTPGAGQFGLENVTSRAVEGPFRAFTTHQDGVTTFRYFVQLTSGHLFQETAAFVVRSALDDPFEGVPIGNRGEGLFHTHGNVRVEGPRADRPGIVLPLYEETEDGAPYQGVIVDTYNTNFSLYGCDIPEGRGLLYHAEPPWYSEELSYMQTCPEEGLDGWAEFRISARGRYTLADVRTDFAPVFAEVQVTPEPGIVLLVASGLIGIGAVSRRRRTK